MSIFTVTNTKNSDAGSLRQAILNANALTGKDIINFGGMFNDGLAHTISLAGSSLSITDDLTIQGTNPGLLTISDNSADRIFDIGNGVTVAINGLTITNSYKDAGGGAISNQGILNLSNTTITGNSAEDGGAIFNEGSLSVSNSTITGNSATNNGGGIFNSGILSVEKSTISDNTAYREGGGIYNYVFKENGDRNLGIVTVTNSTIRANTAEYGGGGIFGYESGTITVSKSLISDNSVNFRSNYYGGGGIFSSGILSVDKSSIIGNTAEYGGGIFGIYEGAITVSKSLISSNNASNGGGIYSSVTLSVNDSAISRNTAEYGGGIYDGISLDQGDGTITVNNSLISDNSAGINGSGGGIYVSGNTIGDTTIGSTITVNNSLISENHGYLGGGIYNEGTITVSNSTISKNYAKYGGAIYNPGFIIPGYHSPDVLVYGSITVENSTIKYNKATTGGGIYNQGALSVSNSSISNNYARDYGGGIYNEPLGIVAVDYSTISGNQAHFGAGIYNTATLTVGNSTIKHNKAFGIELSSGSYESGHGGGIYNLSPGTTTLDYSTVHCNFDTPRKNSTKVIKLDNVISKLITKASCVKV
ncbi:beta strand repeat-containing protein [Nostoc sp. ChiVER01]|uniref:beta strand repeat-containing protein n=1 Tax=Nostoc sp. ChiVER01 TaxID=3075382 RepID=UPI002AD28ACC|nr:right-handed parallel beta-helix repeat-containing protein [Nostoc sp. ChiVER01]MDZ8224959.1 right-handed parallel beta-helix repeat-containing protein [Nostoc sp. ChiVER01]